MQTKRDRRRPGQPSPTPSLGANLGFCIGIGIGLGLLAAAFAPPLRAEERQSVLTGPLLSASQPRDERGLTTWIDHRRRTPSGFLYPWPLAPQPYHGEAFKLRSSLEAGWLLEHGRDREARFTEFADLASGPLIRRFSLEGKQGDGRRRFVFEGGSVARDDGFYRLDLVEANRVRLRLRHDGMPHVYADDARSLFLGSGSQSLRLPPGLVPGDNPTTAIDAALGGLTPHRLVQQRDDSSVDLRVRLRPDLVWQTGYHLDRRHGERLFGGTLGTTFAATSSGSVTELIEPLQSRTHEGTTALEYAARRIQANLRYRTSYYDNRLESLTWQNPFAATDLGFLRVAGPPAGRAALPPDNSSHQISGDVATLLPWNGRFVASGAWTRMEQDERLLPATINATIPSFGDLARARAGARVETWMLQSKLRARPISPLDLHLDFRIFDRDGDTNYTALDPTTGQFGYVVEDSSPAARVGAPPFSHRRWNLETGADWRIGRRTRVGFEYAHEETRRANRARRLTRDDRVRLQSTTRIFGQGTMRLAYDFLARTGSDYDPARDLAYYLPNPLATGLFGPARSLTNFRQFDLARQRTNEVEWRANFPIGQSFDLAFSARGRTRDFGGQYGVRDERGADAGVDASWLPSPKAEAHFFAGYEWRGRRLRTIDSAPGPIASLLPGGPTFPIANTWSWESQVTTLSTGTSVTVRPLATLSFELDYRLLYSAEHVDTTFSATGGALTPGVNAATATRDYVPEHLVDHVLTLSGTKRWNEKISTRLFYRLWDSTIQSVQQTHLQRINQNLYLGTADDDFRVHLVALTAEFRY